MATINVTIQGGDELADKIYQFVGRDSLNLTRSMRASGLYLTRFFSGEVFASRGGAIGESWPSLNPAYAQYKAERWPGRPMLMRTGLMNKSFRHNSTELSASLWNEADYFEYHQEGRGVPQRVMMKLDEQRAARIAKFILSDVTTQMSKAGLV